MAIIGGLIAISYMTILKNPEIVNNQNIASKMASRCLDWYIGERVMNGFNSNNLNCGDPPSYIVETPDFCNNPSETIPPGYSITTKIDCSTLYGEPNKYKTITVKVTGSSPTLKLGHAILSTIIADDN